MPARPTYHVVKVDLATGQVTSRGPFRVFADANRDLLDDLVYSLTVGAVLTPDGELVAAYELRPGERARPASDDSLQWLQDRVLAHKNPRSLLPSQPHSAPRSRARSGKRREHGVPGQLSVYELDVEQDITGFGRHKRCVVMRDVETGLVEVRADDEGDKLPWPTVAQALKVAMGERRIHDRGQRLVFVGQEPWEHNGQQHITYTFRAVRGR